MYVRRRSAASHPRRQYGRSHRPTRVILRRPRRIPRYRTRAPARRVIRRRRR